VPFAQASVSSAPIALCQYAARQWPPATFPSPFYPAVSGPRSTVLPCIQPTRRRRAARSISGLMPGAYPVQAIVWCCRWPIAVPMLIPCLLFCRVAARARQRLYWRCADRRRAV